MNRLGDLGRSKAFRFVLAGVVAIAIVVVGLDVTAGPSTYPIKAVYSSAPGLFPGATVEVLGVPVGTVTSVKNVENKVDVGMNIDKGTHIATAAFASLIAPQVLGQPNVEFDPGYTGGPYLRSGATISQSHTSVPVSTDQLLKQLQRTLKALNPHAVGDLITNLSEDLDGQGAGLNQLIKSAAGTIQLLANKGDDLGQLNGTLAQLTGTLDSDTSQIEQLVAEYDTVSTVIAQHSGQLNNAIGQLAGATTALATVLTPNLRPLEADVGTVTTAGRTLDRNISTVDEVLAQANNLFQGAQRVFSPTYNWLDLNLVVPPGVTGDYVTGLIRDRLAGVCRRLTANHAAGLSATVLTDLASCGNPNSDFFDPLVSQIPTILNTVTGSAATTTATALLQQGLAQIGNITGGSVPPLTTSNSAAKAAATGSGTTTTTTTTEPPSAGSSCGLLSKLFGCTGGLLSSDVAPTKEAATVHLASNTVSGPSLDAPAASLLPPLTSGHQARHAHRGLLSQWMHDVRSWL